MTHSINIEAICISIYSAKIYFFIFVLIPRHATMEQSGDREMCVEHWKRFRSENGRKY